MRHIIIGVLILLAVTGFTVASAWYVSDAVEQTASELEAAYKSVQGEDLTAAHGHVRRAAALWDRHGAYFGTVLRHDEIDGVVGEFARLKVTVEAGDPDEFLPTCAALLATLRHIQEMEHLYFSNLF